MLRNISVIGAGTMGHGIAECFAMHGFAVRLFEPYEPIRNSALSTIQSELEFLAMQDSIPHASIQETLSRIQVHSNLAEVASDADYVIEAIAENPEEKARLFSQLDTICTPDAIFASNTSSIPLAAMATGVSAARKARMMVCHWYNPAHLMPLVELSFYGNMPEETFREVRELYQKIQKKTVRVLKDVPGMVANRLQHSLARQAFALIEEGVCSPEDMDTALMYSTAFRYVTTGLFEAVDMGGIDIWYSTQKHLLPTLANNTVPSSILKQKVDEGKLGLKTGEGFYVYTDDKAREARNSFQKRLIMQLKACRNYEKEETY